MHLNEVPLLEEVVHLNKVPPDVVPLEDVVHPDEVSLEEVHPCLRMWCHWRMWCT